MNRSTALNPTLLNLVFAALSDPSRRSIVEQLRGGEATVSDLAAPLDMSLPAVSKHLRVLENAGLLQRRISGRTHYLKVNPSPLTEVSRWIERHRLWWEGSFDRLEQYLAETETKTETKPKPKTKSKPCPSTKRIPSKSPAVLKHPVSASSLPSPVSKRSSAG